MIAPGQPEPAPGLTPAEVLSDRRISSPTPGAPRPVPSRPLLMMQTEAERQQQRAFMEAEEKKKQEAFTSQLATHVNDLYQRAIRARDESGVDDRLMSALRQRKGVYAPDKLAAIREMESSEIYMLLTEVKCLAAEAWVFETLMPAEDKPWSIQPTTIPELDETEIDAVIQQTLAAMMQDLQAGAQPDPQSVYDYAANLREGKLKMLREEAKERAEKMQDVINDQMEEGGFGEAFDLFVSDLVTFGTGILKGPVMRQTKKRKWGRGGQLILEDSIDYYVDHVSVFDFYPSPEAETTTDGYMCERKRWTVRQLNQLRGIPGVNEDALDRVISQYGDSGYGRDFYQDQERRRLEDKSQTLQDNLIEGFEFHGPIMGNLLRQWGGQSLMQQIGFNELIDNQEYDVCVTYVANDVVRVRSNLSPTNDRVYSKSNYKRLVGSFWGRGVPESMTDIQDVCNAAARSLVNNMAIASGPMVSVNDVTRLADGEELDKTGPWRMYQFKNPNGHQAKPIEFFNINSHANELMTIFERFMAMADERTMIPAYAYGSDRAAGAGKTASGLSMLMNSSSRAIKKVIRGIDLHVIIPMITRLYDLNMLFHPDAEIKGDAQIIAKGAIGMILREQQVQMLTEFLGQTANEFDASLIGEERRMNARREQVKHMVDIPVDKLIPTEEEVRDQLEARAKAAALQFQQQQQLQQQQGQDAPAQSNV